MKSISFWVLFLLISCGYKTTAIPDGFIERSIPGSGPSFAAVKAQIFTPHCIRCHGSAGGVSLSDYQSVKASLNRVAARIEAGTMPPSGALSENLKSILRNWIAAGAPEGESIPGTSSGGTSGGTTGGTGPVDFAMVKDEIFSPSCVSCHGSFGTYSNVKSKLAGIQNAINSGFMPPSGELSQQKKNLLQMWVSAGAPEGNTTGGSTGENPDDCEDDDRLIASGLIDEFDHERVLDHEKEIVRRRRHGCDDDDR